MTFITLRIDENHCYFGTFLLSPAGKKTLCMLLKYREEQRFTQWWLWAILIGIGILPVYALIKQIGLGHPVGDHPMTNLGLVLFALFVLGFVVLFYKMRLITEIDDREIRIRFIPFSTRVFRWEDIESAEIVDYGFVGGWGIRYGSKYGVVYNMSGRIGLAIRTKSGKKMVVGTQRPDELGKVAKACLRAAQNQ
ncbi:MAG: hypothetical protein D6714_17395 [Bacteroidetes bacterium]|nr:MAG: hypothetical protein D6714_17395 [Bacteroidota bacterium]